VLSFIQKHDHAVTGVLSGFDRLVLRGTLRALAYPKGMMRYLWAMGVLLKDFGRHVLDVTTRIKDAATRVMTDAGRPVLYLPSAQTSKEDQARAIAARDGITRGPVCMLTSVEPCRSFEIFRNRETKRLELVRRYRKCLHLYQYWIHPVVGFMNVRIQTWFPLSIQVCLNGREWLARELDRHRMRYQRADNCFLAIADVERAQALMDRQLRVAWPDLLGDIAHHINPVHDQLFARFPVDYYWSVFQSEWATDVMFRSQADLAQIYPSLVRHGMTTFGSPDVMRFLGRPVPVHGGVNRRFRGQVVTDIKDRPEGVRIKHRIDHNSIKAYDKHGSVLRVETTINSAAGFKVFRPKQGKPASRSTWQPMRQGIADLHRRAKVSQNANRRYLDALAAVEQDAPVGTLARKLCQPTELNGRRVRALNPWSQDDHKLLEVIMRGEFAINGLRNADIRAHLFSSPAASPQEERRRSAAVSRKLRLLRAHGILQKVPKSHRYQVTSNGRAAVVALLVAYAANANSLARLAA
jgi:hypothetical protein